MPKLTYRAQTPDDPTFTKVGQYSFEHGKAVTVDDATAERLSGNPWFTGGREAKSQASDLSAGGGGATGDSSVNLAPPPGSGSKTDPGGYVATGEGLVPADQASDVDGANVVEDANADDKGKKGRGKS